MAGSMLRLEPASSALRAAFEDGRLSGAALREDPVLSRWHRVAAQGLSPNGRGEPVEMPSGRWMEHRAEVESRLGLQTRLATTLTEAAAGREAIAVLTDARGIIVHAAGSFRERAVRFRLVCGARWTEGDRGTNAIGTALLEQRPVSVIGAAHYERKNQGLYCYAAPIFDPFGEIVGVLDVTGPAHADDRSLEASVLQGALRFEEALRHRMRGASVGVGSELLHRLLSRVSDPAVVVEAPGHVRMANDAAVAAFGIAPGACGDLEALFGIAFEELARWSIASEPRPQFEANGTRYRLAMDPLVLPDGRVFGIVLSFEPVRRAARSASESASPSGFEAIFGHDPAVVHAKQYASRVAGADLPVLLLAETGTGKELFARAIHEISEQRAGPFVAVNCGALTDDLLMSELFGYGPGAFTGALPKGAEGKIAAAEGGTLFLDEVGEMSPSLQAMLLRVLEDGTYHRVGESRARHAHFRLVAATCRDLPRLVEEGAFRSDLYFRMQGATLELPPLRARSDRVPLARRLIAQLSHERGLPCLPLGDSAIDHLVDHGWPGNVRELKSALHHALVMAAGAARLEHGHFPRVRVGPASTAGHSATRRAAEAEHVQAAVDEAGGNLSQAARQLGIARSTLYRMLNRARSKRGHRSPPGGQR